MLGGANSPSKGITELTLRLRLVWSHGHKLVPKGQRLANKGDSKVVPVLGFVFFFSVSTPSILLEAGFPQMA